MTIDEFKKVDLRVGKIIAAERVEGSEKLIRLQIDIGEPRQIIAGIGKEYGPDELLGKEIVVIANLDTRKMMGLESQGMLLAAQDEGGSPVLLIPAAPVPPGSVVS